MMHLGMQLLVNSQVEIDRAVFEANRKEYRIDYILDRIAQARIQLMEVERKLKRKVVYETRKQKTNRARKAR